MNTDFELGKALHDTYATATSQQEWDAWDSLTPAVQAVWAAVAAEARKQVLALPPGLYAAQPLRDPLRLPPDEYAAVKKLMPLVDLTSDLTGTPQMTVATADFSPGDTVIVRYGAVPSAAVMMDIRRVLEQAGARHVVFVPEAVIGLTVLHTPPAIPGE